MRNSNDAQTELDDKLSIHAANMRNLWTLTTNQAKFIYKQKQHIGGVEKTKTKKNEHV